MRDGHRLIGTVEGVSLNVKTVAVCNFRIPPAVAADRSCLIRLIKLLHFISCLRIGKVIKANVLSLRRPARYRV
jgi:hypothetical protein